MQLPGGPFDFDVPLCGGQTTDNPLRWYTMPNSVVPYNRFWLSYNNTVGQPDQVNAFLNFAADTGNSGYCVPTPPQ